MNQITDQIHPQLNDPMRLPVNPNMNLINQTNIPPLMHTQNNIPLNQNIANQQTGNNPQNEDTSKILFLNFYL
jgi:hypothetical protein